MIKSILSVLSVLLFVGCATQSPASTVADLRYPVEITSAAPVDIPLFAGETVTVDFQLTQSGILLDLTGDTVLLLATTNAQPAGTAFVITGSVGRASSPGDATNGWCYVPINVTSNLPAASVMSWSVAVVSASGVSPRLHGAITISGLASGATNIAQASSVSNALFYSGSATTLVEIQTSVEMSRPPAISLQLYQGETVDLAFQALLYNVPMDLIGATAVMQVTTNGQPAGTSFPVTGVVGRASAPYDSLNGWCSFRVTVGSSIPLTPNQNFDVVVTDAAGNNNVRMHGTITVATTPLGSSSSAVAQCLADPYGAASAVRQWAQIGFASTTQDILNVSSALAGYLPISWTNGPVAIDAGNASTNTYGGLVVVLGESVQSGGHTVAGGQYSHAEGVYSFTSGYGSHAEGSNTHASGGGSHAEGASTSASGDLSHAEGDDTAAGGHGSHAEGEETTAVGRDSHAEGQYTQASGDYSHAEGQYTFSTGGGSHVGGIYAEAVGDYSWVWNGDWNIDCYYSHGSGTFSVNPLGGSSGFYVGESNLTSLFDPLNSWTNNEAQISQNAANIAANSNNVASLSNHVDTIGNVATANALAPGADSNTLHSAVQPAALAIAQTNATDPVARANLGYSPESAFVFDGVNTIWSYTGSPTTLNIPPTIGGKAVTSIGGSAFSECTTLTSVTIPSSVTSIGNAAFASCFKLTSVTLPASVTSIGASAFNGCIRLTSATLPASVTGIGTYAFAYCVSLTSVTIPASVTSLGDMSFANCTGLTSVCFLGNAPSLGPNVFFSDTLTNYFLYGMTGFPTPPATFGGQPTAYWQPNLYGNGQYLTMPSYVVTNNGAASFNALTVNATNPMTAFTGAANDSSARAASAANSNNVAVVSNLTLGAWVPTNTVGGVLTLDWSVGLFRSFAPTDTTYTVVLTNTSAVAPRTMQLFFSTPSNVVPVITWPTNFIWANQLDITSNRNYYMGIIWDGGIYAAVPLYSR